MQIEKLHQLARDAYALGEGMLKSHSGTDQAESELYFGMARVYRAVSMGAEVESAIAAEDARWRAYATEQQRKVAQASRINAGPRAGQSTIEHRWVSIEAFQSKAIHIRHMLGML